MSYRTPETRKRGSGDGPARPAIERPDSSALVDAVPLPEAPDPPLVDELLEALAKNYQFNARATNTRRAYENDFRRFREWCEERGHESLPASPETVVHYLSAHGSYFAPTSLRRWLVGISLVHKEMELPSPCSHFLVRSTLKGIRNEAVNEGREPRRAYPIVLTALKQLVEPIPLPSTDKKISLIDLRDRALMTLAWTCALRASEVGGIRLSDLRDTPRGYVVTFRKSKTNQEGKPHLKALPTAQAGNEDICPNLALRAWLAVMPPVAKGENKNRPLFSYVDRHENVGMRGITPQSVNRIIQGRAQQAGFSQEVVDSVTCHSLRRGFATAAASGKANEHKVLRHVGWRDARMYRHYVEEQELFEDNPATSAGL